MRARKFLGSAGLIDRRRSLIPYFHGALQTYFAILTCAYITIITTRRPSAVDHFCSATGITAQILRDDEALFCLLIRTPVPICVERRVLRLVKVIDVAHAVVSWTSFDKDHVSRHHGGRGSRPGDSCHVQFSKTLARVLDQKART